MKSIPIKIAIWFILFIALLTLGLNMVSEPNTIENVIGFFIIVAIVLISIKTKCLTLINFKEKHEKSN